jgi:predicted ribosome quality control (RQC) complex YloA/Tae2 family protein
MISDLDSIKKQAFIYYLDDDFVIIAGRTSRDNDFISTKVAGQTDWWFHIKGMPGSHVLLRSLSDIEPTKKQLEIAAAAAAYHSKAKTGGLTSVSATLAKNVSKPRGVPAGTVTIKKEKVIKVRPSLPN